MVVEDHETDKVAAPRLDPAFVRQQDEQGSSDRNIQVKPCGSVVRTPMRQRRRSEKVGTTDQ
jgi:hypothetical protein